MGLFRNPKLKNHEDYEPLTGEPSLPPKDAFLLAYICYFILGVGFMLPYNAYVTAIDYFSYIYPDKQVERVFSVAFMLPCVGFLLVLIKWASKSRARARINLGLVLILLSLLVVPIMDMVYTKGQRGLNLGYYITVVAVVVCGSASALVQGGLTGSVGELPEKYMQAVVAGTAASGVLVAALRILTKAALPQDLYGLRVSAILYFIVSSVIMAICLVCYNMVNRLPVIRYYNDLKTRAIESTCLLKNTIVNSAVDREHGSFPVASDSLLGASKELERPIFWHVLRQIKWLSVGLLLINVITMSIYPGYITEDVHSHLLKDWYPIMLISCFNIFDLVGKSLTATFMLENPSIAIGGSFARLLFYPLFYACIHGPHFLHTEIPVVLLTCLLGLTNGYFMSVIMIVAPKTVPLHESETAGIVIILFLVTGLALGSIAAWFWVV